MSTTTEEAAGAYDRLSELKAFDDTKAGVKGLVDAGVTAVPAIFRHHHLQQQVSSSSSGGAVSIPVIDLSSSDARARAEVVAQVKAAASEVGFFQLVNHGVTGELLSETLASVRRFHEAPAGAKRPYYTRDPGRRLRFNSNFDLFQSPAANWRDTLFCAAAPDPPPPEELPPAVRGALLEYGAAARALAARVLALLSEALGLERGRLAGIGCAEGISVVCNYYPPCPEPELTLGCSAHSDPSFLTVLLQDAHAGGGLQARLGGRWVDVPHVAGALVVNVGDLLQLVSNGRFRSVEHRVLANRSRDTARVSVACFCNADIARSTRLYGPIAELTSGPDGGARALYRSVTVQEFLAHYDMKGLDGRPALDHFRLH
ncbi:DIBOA-glucoside dioxygenase BX6-like [Panicum hallii]|jgi:2,4-dihydroxy-1,4-benzoxazin-3-one-glucoside dioxygenase|uniref:DIBOA-glucoside dioxygenase BX6-like n=1 Tax=Panicum hallii TaxID=206008 RepID=UPI000DF4E79F|nr:DIBOA-glucoside dioxygenase BX6-like [Panicum hallii]